MGKEEEEPTFEELLEQIQDEDDFIQAEAIIALGDLGDKRAVEFLINALENVDAPRASTIAESLGKIGDKRAIDPLINQLDRSGYVDDDRAYVAEALAILGEKKGFNALYEELWSVIYTDFPAEVVFNMLIRLGQKEQLVTKLIKELDTYHVHTDWDERILRSFIELFSKLEDPRAIEPLKERYGISSYTDDKIDDVMLKLRRIAKKRKE